MNLSVAKTLYTCNNGRAVGNKVEYDPTSVDNVFPLKLMSQCSGRRLTVDCLVLMGKVFEQFNA